MTQEPSLPDFRVLFEAIPGLYLVLTPQFEIVAVSDAYLEATMTRREAVLGKNIFEVFPDNPDDPAASGVRNLKQSLESVLESRRADSMAVQRYDVRRPEAGGGGFEERFWSPVNSPVFGFGNDVAYIIHRVEDVTEFVRLKQRGREHEEMTEALRTRAGQMESEIYQRAQQVSEANRQLREANEDLRRLYHQIAALMAQADDVWRERLPDQNITGEQPIKPADMLTRVGNLIAAHQQLEAQLLQAQKMEAVGRLAGGVAHDFNNMLTVISGYARMAKDVLPSGELLDYLDEIDRAATRAGSLTKQLLAFSRKQLQQLRVFDLNQIVSGTAELIRRLIGEDISLMTVLCEGACKVRADRTQIEQVIMNLAVNARDAMPNGGCLAVETRIVHIGSEAMGSVRPGSYAMLSMADTGKGMDSETVSRIFEPFFTTKDLGKGTGLGLSTVHGIVEQSGGTVIVESSPGVGSVFQVFLPMATGGVEDEEIDFPWIRRRSQTGTVLVVEDETALRRLVCKILSDAKYEVLEAANAQEAFVLATQCGKPIDLLLTDVLMPGMSGPELVDKLRALRPNLLVLFMSGYDRESLGQREMGPTVRFLPKPFSPQALLAAMHDMFEGGRLDPSQVNRRREGELSEGA